MNKNSLDEFFREKFKDFAEEPDNKVWETIESSLNEKRKKRGLLPIWWKLGGVAALLAVVLYFVNPFENTDTPAIVNTEITEEAIPENGQAANPNSMDNKNTKETEGLKVPKSEALNPQDVSTGRATQIVDAAADDKAPQRYPDKFDSKLKSAVPVNEKRDNLQNSTVADNPSEKPMINLNTINQANDLSNSPEERAMRLAGSEKDQNNIPNGIGAEEQADIEKTEVTDRVGNKSIFDEIEQQEELISDNGAKKWSVGPSIAPVYFSSFGEGSPIHSNFVTNSKSGNLNLSYGLSVAYEVSKKLSVRSGIHKVDYGYNTNDVLFSSSLAASTNNRIDNIDYALTSKNLIVESTANSASNRDAPLSVSNEIAAPSPSRDGRMVQQFGYLEVPVELNYALVDSKIGVNIIGGFSSLFLVDNSVSLESDGASTEIGAANNINNLNFSTNIGLGLNYEVSSGVQLHLEPMFKYQLNTFSDTSGSFQPFSVGIYSGLNFRF